MTKAEMEKQLKEKQEIIDKQKKRIKDQNEKAKEKWDTVSCRLPKGTKARIKALGLSVNGVINERVLAYLDCVEKEREAPVESTKQPKTEPITEPVVEVPQEQPKELEKAHRTPTTEDLQRWQLLFDKEKEKQARKAENKREEEEKREQKEKIREESVLKAKYQFD